MFSVTFIIGATNETFSLQKTVRSIIKMCNKSDIDKIVIVTPKDVASDCYQTILELEQMYPGIVFGKEQKRPLVGGAIQTGFDCAQSSHLMLLSSDLSIALDSIPKLIEREKRCPNGIVKVSRWINRDSFHNYSPVRKRFNKLAQRFLRLLFQTSLTDLTAPAQIMPTALCRSILWKEKNFPALIELVLVPLRLKVQITEIPGSCYGREEGKSHNSVFQTALYLNTAIRIRFTKPEKLLKPMSMVRCKDI